MNALSSPLYVLSVNTRLSDESAPVSSRGRAGDGEVDVCGGLCSRATAASCKQNPRRGTERQVAGVWEGKTRILSGIIAQRLDSIK